MREKFEETASPSPVAFNMHEQTWDAQGLQGAFIAYASVNMTDAKAAEVLVQDWLGLDGAATILPTAMPNDEKASIYCSALFELSSHCLVGLEDKTTRTVRTIIDLLFSDSSVSREKQAAREQLRTEVAAAIHDRLAAGKWGEAVCVLQGVLEQHGPMAAMGLLPAGAGCAEALRTYLSEHGHVIASRFERFRPASLTRVMNFDSCL